MASTPELTSDDDDWVPPSADGTRPSSGPESGGAGGKSDGAGGKADGAGGIADALGRGLDTKAYQSELDPLDIPAYEKPRDRTPASGEWSSGSTAGRRDELTSLTLAQEAHLLAINNIYLSTRQLGQAGGEARGAMAAYVVGAELEPARKLAVRFRKIALRPPSNRGVDSVTYAYDAFESHLQRQFVSNSKTGFGIPMLFRVDASHSYSSASAQHSDKVAIHFARSQTLPKAVATLEFDDIEIDETFVTKVRSICDSAQTPRQKADDLLRELQDYGHFVPLSIILGGRISLQQVTELSDWSTFEATKQTFGVAADARIKVSSAPVDVGGGNNSGIWGTEDQRIIQQAKSMLMELKGGDERLASSNPDVLGMRWVNSVGPYEEWATIGFGPKSLVPIIEFLPADLRKACVDILKAFFKQNLDVRNTALAGNISSYPFDPRELMQGSGPNRFSGDLAKSAIGIAQIVINAEGNVDGLRIGYSIAMGGNTAPASYAATYGNHRGEQFDQPPITLKPGEKISSIEAWVDPDADGGTLRRIAFNTNRGARYPDDKGFYGFFHKEHDQFKIITAPRVRALRGYSDKLIRSIGLTYLDLAANAPSRQFLLAMEPFLFPTGNFGKLD